MFVAEPGEGRETDLAGPLLDVQGVTVRFGGITAVDDVSFQVGQREICGLIGPNGAGKTTLFNCISGIYRYDAGDVRFAGRSIRNAPRHLMGAAGIGRTFQNLALFRSLSVRDNVLTGAFHHAKSGFAANMFRLPVVRREEAAAEARLQALLRLLKLEDLQDVGVAELPFGTQKRVEMARALIGEPKLLLLDEPACGLNHGEVEELEGLLRSVRQQFDLSILLVEHHMNLVMRLSDHVVALEFGRKIADGLPDQVRNEPEVIRAYLGESEHAAA